MPFAKRVPKPPPDAACAAIRRARYDMTEYVIHITSSLDSLISILNAGKINASFSAMGNVYSTAAKPTVRGPRPAVCFTDQPLWALIDTVNTCGRRWSGYGIAFHKVPLFEQGGRPVWYVSSNELGPEVTKGHKKFQEGKRIHDGLIPVQFQYLCVRYDPHYSQTHYKQIDFTWEREWRHVSPKNWLPLWAGWGRLPVIVVNEDADKPLIREELKRLADEGSKSAGKIRGIVSLETAARELENDDKRYGRIETWPFPVAKKKVVKKFPKCRKD